MAIPPRENIVGDDPAVTTDLPGNCDDDDDTDHHLDTAVLHTENKQPRRTISFV